MKKILAMAFLITLPTVMFFCGFSWASSADTFSSESLDKLGRSESEMRHIHGEPLSTIISDIRNPHWPDVIDKTVEYSYEYLSFLFYRPSQTPGTTILMRIDVTDPEMVFSGLRIGSTKKEVQSLLGCGTPWENDLVFEDADGFESVNIRFNNKEKITRFIFIPYSD
ncbi:MAG TPA: hypothetical protein ENN89_00770 [Synergistetes bacterium]|nr:hypothetical protein [Synergistota bacterium]